MITPKDYSYLVPEMIRLYKGGMGITKIAAHLHIGKKVVRRYLDKDGLIEYTRPAPKTVLPSEQRMLEAIHPCDIAVLRTKIKVGDVVSCEIEVHDSEDERLLVPVRRNMIVVKKLPHGVQVAPEGKGTSSYRMVTYVDLLQEVRQRDKR